MAGESASYLAAPANDFFFKRLCLMIFSQAAPAPAPGILLRGHKKPALALDYW